VQATPLAAEPAAQRLLEQAFASKSNLLCGTAYRYAGRLRTISTDLERYMRLGLIGVAGQDRLIREWPAVQVQIARLVNPRPQL
jgi:hypothetical protein